MPRAYNTPTSHLPPPTGQSVALKLSSSTLRFRGLAKPRDHPTLPAPRLRPRPDLRRCGRSRSTKPLARECRPRHTSPRVRLPRPASSDHDDPCPVLNRAVPARVRGKMAMPPNHSVRGVPQELPTAKVKVKVKAAMGEHEEDGQDEVIVLLPTCWRCTRCTLLNHRDGKTCAACGAAFGETKRASAASVKMEAGLTWWTCTEGRYQQVPCVSPKSAIWPPHPTTKRHPPSRSTHPNSTHPIPPTLNHLRPARALNSCTTIGRWRSRDGSYMGSAGVLLCTRTLVLPYQLPVRWHNPS